MTAQQYLDIAIGTERWLQRHQHETEHGLVWGLAEEVPDKYFHSLYMGSAGIALFYLELAKATQDKSYLEVVRRAGTELQHKIGEFAYLPCAPMGGWSGYSFVLRELGLALDDPSFTASALRCAQAQRDQAQEIGRGIGWVQEMPYGKLTGHSGEREIYDVAEGAAGAALYWLYAYEEGFCDDALTWSRDAANRLLEVAEPAEGGLRWQLMNDIPWAFDAPNFAHGTAGVAYFFARMYELTKEDEYLDAALKGAGHVQAMAEDIEGGGHLVPHVLDDGRENRFYLGMCHGPPGTARLYYLLSLLTGDAAWMDWGRGLDDGLIAMGAPEERSRGYWNNISQCCADAGIGDHAVNFYRISGDGFYLDLAERVAKELERRARKEEGCYSWPQAEHRSQPDFVQTQTGYMQGAAGVASFFVHLATTMEGTPVKIAFPDSPFRRLG